jgi:hypothetical protein
VDPAEAAEYLRTRDAARKRYVAKYYDRDIDDPLLYHLVVNTDRVTYGEAARLILGAVHERIDRTAPVGAAPRAVAPAIFERDRSAPGTAASREPARETRSDGMRSRMLRDGRGSK